MRMRGSWELPLTIEMKRALAELGNPAPADARIVLANEHDVADECK